MFALRALVSLILFFVFLFAGFYGYHLYKSPSERELSKRLNWLRKYYPEEILMTVGNNLANPDDEENHFLRFSVEKERGAVRIGAFGDSFTFGEEVHGNASWPVQLQTLLSEAFPHHKVEVLNFGRGGHGFREQFILWEHYTYSYNLDYILYGPRGLWYDRDLTFQKNPNIGARRFFVFPGDRFILSKNGGVKRMSLKGSTPEEKYKNYYTFFPTWTALRYDTRPFRLWELYLPFLRGKLKNLFYYSDLPADVESAKINQILFRKMQSANEEKILLLSSAPRNKKILENYEDIKRSHNLNFFDSFIENFLYRVFGHASSLGNELTAHVYFNALMGKTKFRLNVFSCRFSPKKMGGGVKNDIKIDLNHVKQIRIGTGDTAFGELRVNSPAHEYMDDGGFSGGKSEGVKSFIGFSGRSINDFGLSPYIPLPFELKTGMEVYVEFPKGEIVSLGRIEALDIFEKFFNLYVDYLDYRRRRPAAHVYFITDELPLGFREKLSRYSGKRVVLKIGDYTIGELRAREFYGRSAFRLNHKAENTFIMMGPRGLLREQQLPNQFPLQLHYIMKDDRIFRSRVPEWSCRRERKDYRLSLPNFKPLRFK